MSASISSLFSSAEIKTVIGQAQQRIDAPITLEQSQIKTDEAQISALGKVKGAISSLNGALSTLMDPASVNPMVASVSNNNATAVVTSSAVAGSYNLSGIKLAKSQEIYSKTYASASAKLGSGSGGLTFSFASGKSATISLASSQDSLTSVASAVNQAKAGVTASVVQTASGAKLVFQGTSAGSGQAFTVSGSGAFSGVKYGSGSGATFTLAQSARNASFSVNGVPVTENSNTNIGLVTGVTLSLSASGSATVNVTQSAKSLSSTLSSFTSQLNTAISTISKEIAYTPAKTSSSASGSKAASVGPLLGNVQVQQLKQELIASIAGAAGSGISAGSLGFSISSSGKVSFSSTQFSSAYQKNPAAVDNLVKQIGTAVKAVVSGAIGSGPTTSSNSGSGSGTLGSGFIGASTTDLNSTVSSLKSEIEQQMLLGNQQITNIENQFNAAISGTSGANSTLAYLGALLSTTTKSGSGG